MILSETHHAARDMYRLAGYTQVSRLDRSEKGGGQLILAKSDHIFICRYQQQLAGLFGSHCEVGKQGYTYKLCGAYVVPASSRYAPQVSVIAQSLETSLADADLILGDLNACPSQEHAADEPLDQRAEDILSLLDGTDWLVHDLPGHTRVSSWSSTTPDALLCQAPLASAIHTQLIPSPSDHLAVLHVLQGEESASYNAVPHAHYLLSRADWPSFAERVEGILSQVSNAAHLGVHDHLCVLEQALRQAARHHVPRGRPRRGRRTTTTTTTTGIRQARSALAAAHSEHQAAPEDPLTGQFIDAARKHYNQLLHDHQRATWRRFASSIEEQPQKASTIGPFQLLRLMDGRGRQPARTTRSRSCSTSTSLSC